MKAAPKVGDRVRILRSTYDHVVGHEAEVVRVWRGVLGEVESVGIPSPFRPAESGEVASYPLVDVELVKEGDVQR